MDTDDELEGHGSLATGLDRFGRLLLFAGAGLVVGALGMAAATGFWLGAAMGVAGLWMRAAANFVAVREIEDRGVTVPAPLRAISDEELLGINQAVGSSPELDVAAHEGRFAAMICAQRNAHGEFGRGG